MESNKTLPQLEQEVKDLGLIVGQPSGKNGKYLKTDYIEVLQRYNLIKRFGGLERIPVNYKFRLTFDSPQLAYNYFDLKPKDQELIWDDPNIWLTEKINGVRGTLIHSKAEGYSCFGRDLNDSTFIWEDYARRLIDPSIVPIDVNGVFDVEIQLGNQNVREHLKSLGYEINSDYQVISALLMLPAETFDQIKNTYPGLFKYKLIDVYFMGADYRFKPYSERETHFENAVLSLKKAGFNIERPQYCKDPVLKKAFHEGIMKNGGEGTIAVFTDKPCLLDGKRPKDGWIKIKRPIFALLFEKDALTDTVDGWVSKVMRVHKATGLVHTVEVSAYRPNGEVTVVAQVEAIPLSIRMGANTENGLCIGSVVELSGTVWKEGLIQDANIVRLRYDKQDRDCVLSV